MLDLNTLIKQRNLIRKYQGDGDTGVTTDIPVSRVGPMGAYSAPGPGITKTGDIWSILPEVPVEGEKETNEETIARYQEMFNQGVTPEIPYGKRVHGYDSPYIDPSETLASVFKVKRDNKGLPLERYDERDMPMLEYLYGITESATDINVKKEADLKANAPNEADYNLGTYTGKNDFKVATDKYWEGVQDDKMSGDRSGKGHYKDPTTGQWTLPTAGEITDAYNNKRNDLFKQESSLGIQAGVQSIPGDVTSRSTGAMTGGDALMALAMAPALLEPTAAGETAWAIAAAKYAPGILALGYTATQAWDMLTEQGAFSDATQAQERLFKSKYESLTSTSLGERVWETVNGVQGLYVSTTSGSVFVSRDEVESRLNWSEGTGYPGFEEGAEAGAGAGATTLPPWAIPGDEKWINPDGSLREPTEQEWANMSDAEREAYNNSIEDRVDRYDKSQAQMSEDPDDDESKWRKFWKNTKGWSKEKIDKAIKIKKSIEKYTLGRAWRKAAKTPWKELEWAGKGTKVMTLWTGSNMASRWGARFFVAHKTGLFDAMGITEPDIEDAYSEKDIKTYNTILDLMKGDTLTEENVNNVVEYIESLPSDYIQDSMLFNTVKDHLPSDSTWEGESGYKGQGTDSTRSKKDFKTGGVIRQFQEGGVMSRLLKYQGDLDPNIAYQYDTLPADWGGFQQQPAITDVNSTYGNYPMSNWDQPGVDAGTNIQPTQAELNQAGFQNVQTWRDWVNAQENFGQYDWGKLEYWGPKHQRAWNWTQSASPANVVDDTDADTNTNTDTDPTVTKRQGLTEEEKYKMKLQMQQKSMKQMLGKGLELGASVLPYAFAWGQANKMEGEADEFSTIPDIKSPEVHIKAPINEVNQQIEDVDTTMNAVVENLKNKGASASAILAAEKQRRQAKDQLNAKKEDLLLKADAESQKLTGAMKLDAAKQNQVKDIKMKLEEMDFRTATKKAKIDIMSKLVKTITGYSLDQKKLYSDKNIMAVVTSAITAGTGMMERQTLLNMMMNMNITEEDIREVEGGDDFLKNLKIEE